MKDNKKTGVIIAAAGAGRRMGGDIPKQFLKTGGVPVIVKTVNVFEACPLIDDIIVVAAEGYIEVTKKMIEGCGSAAEVIEGGDSRQDSVFNAVEYIKKNRPDWGIVLIHDAARPFVTRDIIEKCVEGVKREGAAVAVVPVKDTIREKGRTLDRSGLYAVQTPQGFARDIIISAHEKAREDGFAGTDDISLVERIGGKTVMTDGSYSNIKITTPEDLPPETRAGTGYDVHQLAPGRDLVLGGVDIPYEKGLFGHSDADVLLHAVMDALLGAAALGDIGRHFPDSDEKYRGISSMKLLKETGKLISKEGYTVGNIDVTLVAQEPKVSVYIEKMRENIAACLGIDTALVNVKATTTEGLGYTGRGEGMAAQAVCILHYYR